MKISELSRQIHKNAKEKGFWDNPRETGTLLMLCVSELSEALEADRKDKHVNWIRDHRSELDDWKDSPIYSINHFQTHIKDTFEDELADTMIRIMDLAGSKQIDLEWHIEQKMKYNETRERMHGKNY